MYSCIRSYGINGIDAYAVTVEVTLNRSLPSFDIVGLPDAAVKESRSRVQSAVTHSGYQLPVAKITVNLAPASQKKSGPVFDLAIFLAVMAAAEQLPQPQEDTAFLGELSLSGELRPDILIPFKLDKKAAKAGLMKHLEGKKLLPKIFKDQNHIDEIRGIYVPFWLFNTEADANIRYRGTRTRFWSDSKYNYTETSYFLINRGGTIGFEKVPVDGDSKIPDDLMESIEPYDLKEAVPFQAAYLAGYLADRYDVDSEKSAPRANERVKKSVERAFEETVTGYATVMTENSSVQLRDGSAQYALLPVWILNTTWEGKHYLFAMNGQTGKFVGDLPADKNAARKMTIKFTVIITIVVYILRLILWMFGI